MAIDDLDDLSENNPSIALLRESLLRYRSSVSGPTPPGPAIETFLAPPQGPDELGRLAHYRVLHVLGQGGMGCVYEAEDIKLERRLALKILLPVHAGDAMARERFLREARALALLSHSHIVTVYEVGIARSSDGLNEIPYLAMQLLLGETLEARILQQGALPTPLAVRIARETAEGLRAAHEKGLIHRDIKPSNIWLEQPDDLVKILDFGLARGMNGTNPHLSVNGLMVGTPSFMAPEQARGDSVDARADLFSLGCVLYTILAGEVPFDGPSVMAVLTRLAVYDPPPLSRKVPTLSPALSDLVQELLAKNPADRPANAREVVKRLRALEEHPQLAEALHRKTTIGARVVTDGEIPIPPLPLPSQPRRPSRRAVLLTAGALAAAGGLGAVAWWWNHRGGGEPIRVGVLHSASGSMQNSEMPVMEMTQLALEELSTREDFRGRSIDILLGDGASSETVFAKEAERLISQEGVVALFGCWTSASRKAVMAVVEKHKHLLFYPVQYEGLEQSPRIVYTGAAPNQQLLPAARWCIRKNKKSFFLVGSDYIFPRTANVLLRHQLEADLGPDAVRGELYAPLGSINMRQIITAIKAAQPEVILSTINGASNTAFFQALRDAKITPQQTHIVSFSLDEQSVRQMHPALVAGSYTAWNYFACLPGAINAEFKRRYQRRYTALKTVTDPMEAAWLGVQFWANAVRQCGRPEDRDAVLRCVSNAPIHAPEGPNVSVDPDNHHTWKYFRIGQITPTGEITVVHEDASPTRPEPYPKYRTREEWHAWQLDLYHQWGNRWSPSPDE